MKKILGYFIASALFLVTLVTSAIATTSTIGNDAVSRPYSDSWSNFVVVDTNNPAAMDGYITEFNYWASRTNEFRFIVIDDTDTVQWISESITPTTTGDHTYIPTNPVQVYTDWNVGVYFASTGAIPFEYNSSADTAGYTNLNSGKPEVGDILNYENVGNRSRIYSYNATVTDDVDDDGVPNDEDCNAHDPGITILEGTKACVLYKSGVPGEGILTAPGLEKEFNPNSKAAVHAGKKE